MGYTAAGRSEGNLLVAAVTVIVAAIHVNGIEISL